MTTAKNPLYELEDDSIHHVDALLFAGSVFGGKSLVTLLEEYTKNGPHHPVRHDLLQHLQRCTIAITEMDAFIRARARVHPNRKPRKAK